MPELKEVADHVSEMLVTANLMPLQIGRVLAETFYEGSRELYASHGPKPVSLRRLHKLLRERGPTRGITSLRQMIAVHFQEPDLNLSPECARVLTYRARVELLRVHAAEEKSEYARKAIEHKWSSRELARQIKGFITPAMAPRTRAERLLRKSLLLCHDIENWSPKDADDLARVKEVIQAMTARLRTIQMTREDLKPYTPPHKKSEHARPVPYEEEDDPDFDPALVIKHQPAFLDNTPGSYGSAYSPLFADEFPRTVNADNVEVDAYGVPLTVPLMLTPIDPKALSSDDWPPHLRKAHAARMRRFFGPHEIPRLKPWEFGPYDRALCVIR